MTSKKSNKKITVAIIVWDITHNALGRAYMMADILSVRFNVKIVGFVFQNQENSVWSPLSNIDLPLKIYSGSLFPAFKNTLEIAASEIEADVIIASKLRLPTVQLGLLMKSLKNRPLIIDIDDYEVGFYENHSAAFEIGDVKKPHSETWTRYCETLYCHADSIFVSNQALQEKYGGTIVPHVRNENLFDPSLYDKYKRRSELGISCDDKVVLFLGTPRRHKGLGDLLEALKASGDPSYKLCVMGSFPREKLKNDLLSRDDGRLLLFPDQPYSEIATNVAVADLVCLLQDSDGMISHYQLPAKAIDAISMGVPVMAIPTRPMEHLINKGLVIPTSNETVVEDLKEVFSKIGFYEKKQLDNRAIFLKEFSYESALKSMEKIILKSIESPKALSENALSYIHLQTDLIEDVVLLMDTNIERNRVMHKRVKKLEKKLSNEEKECKYFKKRFRKLIERWKAICSKVNSSCFR